jgi:hypothetical protein
MASEYTSALPVSTRTRRRRRGDPATEDDDMKNESKRRKSPKTPLQQASIAVQGQRTPLISSAGAETPTLHSFLAKRSLATRYGDLLRGCAALSCDFTFKDQAEPLGSGTNATVFAVEIDGEYVACKTSVKSSSAMWDDEYHRELVIEQRVAETLTHHFVSTSLLPSDVPDNAPSCPNFTALMRSDFDYEALAFKGGAVHRQLYDKPLSTMYTEVCRRRTLLNYISDYVGSSDEKSSKRLATSLAGQLMMAVLAMASIGLQHNDMRPPNILVLSYDTPEEGLLYCIPRECEETEDIFIRLPGGKGIPLLLVSDFGTASVYNWENDVRFTPPAVATSKRLANLYYSETKRVSAKTFERLYLNEHDDYGAMESMRWTAIDNFQRDMAAVMSMFESLGFEKESPRRWLLHLKEIGRCGVDALTERRPTSYTGLLLAMLDLLTTSDLLRACLEPEKVNTDEPAWRLPTIDQGEKINEKLRASLEADVQEGFIYSLYSCP